MIEVGSRRAEETETACRFDYLLFARHLAGGGSKAQSRSRLGGEEPHGLHQRPPRGSYQGVGAEGDSAEGEVTGPDCSDR